MELFSVLYTLSINGYVLCITLMKAPIARSFRLQVTFDEMTFISSIKYLYKLRNQNMKVKLKLLARNFFRVYHWVRLTRLFYVLGYFVYDLMNLIINDLGRGLCVIIHHILVSKMMLN